MENEYAKVTGQDNEDDDKSHLVRNPGLEYAICDCDWAKNGNLCEHVFKVIKFCREKGLSNPSMSMFHYSKALIDMLHCPPFDSLVRDRAVCLAVWVQMQLSAQSNVKPKHAGSEAEDCDLSPNCHDGPPVEIPSDDMEVDSSSVGIDVENGMNDMVENTGSFEYLEKDYQCS
ncbi:hypothetical protein CASFOL_042244 [Castilleja foliolosa]|uniref:SWIM-type domain-containing protein n=1 Tax=Castilleja foliolosa TaxID=1961234 RepID=A0ABD3BBE4_9LAMI